MNDAPTEKMCHNCGRLLPLEAYGRSARSYDGRANKCNDCIRAQRESPEHKERTRLYDEWRRGLDHRKADLIEQQRRRRERLPERKRARDLVARHLTPEPCVICGAAKAEGHHEDYDKPLDVVWLCRRHHREYHQEKFCLWRYEDA